MILDNFDLIFDVYWLNLESSKHDLEWNAFEIILDCNLSWMVFQLAARPQFDPK